MDLNLISKKKNNFTADYASQSNALPELPGDHIPILKVQCLPVQRSFSPRGLL